MSFEFMTNPKLHAIPNLVEGKILLVDDDLEDLGIYTVALYRQGYQVMPCDSYDAALRWLDSEMFDFMILSQGGPSFEGREVLERATRPDRRVPTLIVTHWVDMSIYVEAMSAGAVDYLEKSADPSEMIRAVKLYLKHAHQPRLDRLERRGVDDQAEGVPTDPSSTFEFGGPGDC